MNREIYYFENGEPQDKKLMEPILAGANVLPPVWLVQELGLTEEEVKALYGSGEAKE